MIVVEITPMYHGTLMVAVFNVDGDKRELMSAERIPMLDLQRDTLTINIPGTAEKVPKS